MSWILWYENIQITSTQLQGFSSYYESVPVSQVRLTPYVDPYFFMLCLHIHNKVNTGSREFAFLPFFFFFPPNGNTRCSMFLLCLYEKMHRQLWLWPIFFFQTVFKYGSKIFYTQSDLDSPSLFSDFIGKKILFSLF